MKNPDGRKEFLKDIASFANAAGGYLLFGIDEAQGVPTAVNGLAGVDADAEMLRLEQMARDSIDPRIPGLRTTKIAGFPQGPVIAVYVPRSWARPHRVAAEADSRFWSRGSNGKFAMDTSQIRNAFLQGAEIPDRIRRFRDDRLIKIVDNETPLRLKPGLRLILHLIPTVSITDNATVDLARVAAKPPPCLGGSGSFRDTRYNFDGHVSLGGAGRGYVQVFRNGIFEAVSAEEGRPEDQRKYVNLGDIEEELAEGTERLVAAQRRLELETPISILVSIVGVRGYELKKSLKRGEDEYPQVDRDTLLLPSVEIVDFEADLKALFRPSFDALWQAFGQPRSYHYGKDGLWNDKFKWE